MSITLVYTFATSGTGVNFHQFTAFLNIVRVEFHGQAIKLNYNLQRAPLPIEIALYSKIQV